MENKDEIIQLILETVKATPFFQQFDLEKMPLAVKAILRGKDPLEMVVSGISNLSDEILVKIIDASKKISALSG